MSEAETKLPKDIAAENGNVNVQINGKWHQFPKGTRLADACRSVGANVPCFCYHPKLAVVGSCRMCLVEQGMPARLAPGQAPAYDDQGYQPIQWMPRPIISCANMVAENMAVRTDGAIAREARRGVMEFLLSSHPLDCPICDQAGECKLQEHAIDHGQAASRYTEMKTKKGKDLDIGPNVNLDQERCVLCGRCIRFMRDVMGDPVLSFAQRGTNNAITIYPGRRLDSNYSLNTVDICPVGALTSKDFRFQMRVWFLKRTNSIDVNCGTGSNIIIWSRQDKVHRITPRENNDVNSAWMPDSHRLNYKYINSDQRIPQAIMRTDEGAPHRPTAWEPTIASVKEALQRVSPEKIAIIASGRMTNEELYLAGRLAKAIGTTHIDIVPRMGESDNYLISADRNPNTTGAAQILGLEKPGSSIDTIRKGVASGSIKAVIALGEDLTAEAGFTVDDLKSLDYLVTVCHSANDTARNADVVLPGVTFAEKYGTMINVTGRLQRLNQAIHIYGMARDDWQILRDLCVALDPASDTAALTSAQSVLSAIAKEIPAFECVTWGNIGDLGRQILETGVTIPMLEREKAQPGR